MNTEFPSRVPTIRNQQSVSSSQNTPATSSVGTDPVIKKQIVSVLKEAVENLKTFSTKVSEFFKLNVSKTSTKDDNKNEEEASSARTKGVQLLQQNNDILKRLTNAVSNFLSRYNTVKAPPAPKPAPTGGETNDPKKPSWKNMFSKFSSTWTRSIDGLRSSISGISSSVGSAVSSVFGGGLIGNAIGNATSKAFSFVGNAILAIPKLIGKVISAAFSKALSAGIGRILMGLAAFLLPKLLIIGLIVLAVYALVKYSKEIWDAIKWVGYCIDQGIDYIVSKLPGASSKYEDAREELARKTHVSKEAILSYFGDTVRGRNEAYEALKRIKAGDYAYLDELTRKLRKEGYNWEERRSITPESAKNSKPNLMQQIQNITNTNITNNYGVMYDEEGNPIIMQPEGVKVPVQQVNNTNNQTTVNTNAGKNAETTPPDDSLPKDHSDAAAVG